MSKYGVTGRYLKIDTAGQEKFHTITHAFYKLSQGVLLVFDLTDMESFESLHKWLNNIRTHSDPTIVKYLIGNKCDLEENRQIPYEKAHATASSYGMRYFETSARSGENVLEALQSIVTDIYNKYTHQDLLPNDRISLHHNKNSEKEGRGCC